jgi:hypothetical protein
VDAIPDLDGRGRNRRVDILTLTAFARRWHHHPPCERRGDIGAVVAADQVQAEVQPADHDR